jgi:hypothetical protein
MSAHQAASGARCCRMPAECLNVGCTYPSLACRGRSRCVPMLQFSRPSRQSDDHHARRRRTACYHASTAKGEAFAKSYASPHPMAHSWLSLDRLRDRRHSAATRPDNTISVARCIRLRAIFAAPPQLARHASATRSAHHGLARSRRHQSSCQDHGGRRHGGNLVIERGDGRRWPVASRASRCVVCRGGVRTDAS